MPSSSKKGSHGPVSVPQPPVPETVMIGSLSQPQIWKQSKTAPEWLNQSDPSEFDQRLQQELRSMMGHTEAPSSTNLSATIRFLCVLSCLYHPDGRPISEVVFSGTRAQPQPEGYEVLSARKLIKVQVDERSRCFLGLRVYLSSKHRDIYLGDELLKWMFKAGAGVPEAIFWDAFQLMKTREPIGTDEDFPSLNTVLQMMKVYEMLRDTSKPRVIRLIISHGFADYLLKQAHDLKNAGRPRDTYELLVDSVDRILGWMDADTAQAPHPDHYRTMLIPLRSSMDVLLQGVY